MKKHKPARFFPISRRVFAASALLLFLTGCDPAKILTIKVHDKANSSVTVYTNNKIVPFGNKNDGSKLIIHVPYGDTTVKTFNYGIGNWPNESIGDLAANIDSISIVNRSGQLILSAKPDIQAYLKKNRSGYAGSVLTIQAK